jgi:hypothetical protein
MRVQIRVFEILTHEIDGTSVRATLEEQNIALSRVAEEFAPIYENGVRCPLKIAEKIEGILLEEVMQKLSK